MIQFKCRCSHAFDVPESEAGTSLQCPSCGLLVDVPTLEELPGLSAGGSFEVELAEAPAPKPSLLARSPVLGYAPRRMPSREDVASVDRRPSLREFLNVGQGEDELLALKGEDPAGAPARPKYDPTTGELIKPLDVILPPKPPPLMAQPASLAYERAKKDERQVSIWFPFTEMFAAPNLVVCGVVTAMCLLQMVLGASVPYLFLTILFPIGLLLMTIAHFANVIDEVGPTGTDELPTPLRGASLYDDMVRPLFQVMVAYMLAYAPVVLFNLYVQRLPWQVNLGLIALFFVLVPATLLTMTTSGAANNLIPHRMFSVIGASGWHYWVVTAMGFVSTFAFMIGLLFCLSVGTTVMHRLFVGPISDAKTLLGVPHIVEFLMAVGLMFAGVYLVHVFCWQLGLLYRFHHERFSWVLQKHDKTERDDVLAQLHRHRQSELEAKAAAARRNLEAREAARPGAVRTAQDEIPVAQPVDPRP
jgi:predicted Fe-S protein YdhL (DUF1289 family)